MRDLDKEAVIYNKGFKAGQEHSMPSPDTKTFMKIMEQEIKTINEKLDNIPTRDEMKLCIQEAVDKTLEKADQKYAPISIANVVWAILGAVGFSFLGFLGWLIYTATMHVGK